MAALVAGASLAGRVCTAAAVAMAAGGLLGGRAAGGGEEAFGSRDPQATIADTSATRPPRRVTHGVEEKGLMSVLYVAGGGTFWTPYGADGALGTPRAHPT